MITTLDSTLLADLARQVSGSVLGPQDRRATRRPVPCTTASSTVGRR